MNNKTILTGMMTLLFLTGCGKFKAANIEGVGTDVSKLKVSGLTGRDSGKEEMSSRSGDSHAVEMPAAAPVEMPKEETTSPERNVASSQQEPQQQSQQQQSQPQAQPQSLAQAPVAVAPVVDKADASNYDQFHPLKYNYVSSNQAECSAAATERAGFTVTCTQGGGCDGKNPKTYGACFLAPASKEFRHDSTALAQTYAAQDMNFPKIIGAARVLRQLYIGVLGREPDYGGFYYWMNAYFNNNGSEPVHSITYLANSIIKAGANTEYASASVSAATATEFLKEIYLGLLNRPIDSAGLSYWVDDMIVRGQTADDVLNNIYLSQEFKEKMAAHGLQ